MNRILSILTVGLLLATGCTKDADAPGANGPDDAVPVRFSLQAVETGHTVQPMSATTSYRNWIKSEYRVVVLRKIDTRWIVDDIRTEVLDKDNADLQPTVDFIRSDFSLVLRPGDYRIVAVINDASMTPNEDLKVGTVVADSSDPGFVVPPLATYFISTHPFNTGYRQLAREIFVAVGDFTVPRQGDLHSQPMEPVVLTAIRRVGKLRLLLKNKPANKIGFNPTQHQAYMTLRSADRPFVQGIDALGGSYYGSPEVYEMKWTFNLEGDYHYSGSSPYPYLITQTNSTVFSPYLLADPDVPALDFEATFRSVNGASGGYTYLIDKVFPLVLAPSRLCGIVLQPDGRILGHGAQTQVGAEEAVDDEGVTEDATTLFDPYFEWNALNDE